MKVKELIYMVMDELKVVSDDAFFTESHILFLASKYRAMLLKQRYSDIRRRVPESDYQEICLDLEKYEEDIPCRDSLFVRSVDRIPDLLGIGNNTVYLVNFMYNYNIAFISRERMRFVGYNKYLANTIYCSIGPDRHLYFKSMNPQFKYLKKATFVGVFEDVEEASEYLCNGEGDPCDIMEREFPLEEGLVNVLIQMVVKELSMSQYRYEDSINNAKDNWDDAAHRQGIPQANPQIRPTEDTQD